MFWYIFVIRSEYQTTKFIKFLNFEYISSYSLTVCGKLPRSNVLKNNIETIYLVLTVTSLQTADYNVKDFSFVSVMKHTYIQGIGKG